MSNNSYKKAAPRLDRGAASFGFIIICYSVNGMNASHDNPVCS